MLRNFLFVAIGGAIGSALRYGAALLIPRNPDVGWPWSTLAVNIVGSFIIGILAQIAVRNSWMSGPGYLLLATGICGGFTTFSSLSLECIQMMQRGRMAAALLYAGFSFVVGLAFCFTGMKLVEQLPPASL
jgi:CrcB protein